MSPTLLNAILWIVFSLVIVISLLAGLLGFLKGIYKTTLKTIVKTILIVVFLFVTPVIATNIGNIDLSNFNISFVVKETTIKFTTIEQTLADIITASGVITPLNGLSLYETAILISISGLSYAVFFILCILIQLFGSLISAILYNGIFKWFLPVENKKDRKMKKHQKAEYELTSGLESDKDDVSLITNKKKWPLFRLPSLFLGIAQEFVFLCVLLSPLTAASRVVIKNDDNISYILKMSDVDDSEFRKYTSTIEKAPLYNMLGVVNFDTSINYRATRVKVNGQYVTLDKLVDSLFDIAKPLIDSDAITYDKALGNVTLNLSYLLSKTMISSLCEKVITNNILVALIPPAIDMGLNSISNPDFVVPKINFSDIDWSNDIKAINEIYSKVYDAGIVSQFIADDNKKFTYDNFLIECGKLSDSEISNFTDIFTRLSSLDIFKKNAGKILSGIGSLLSSRGLEILPISESDYADVDYEKDMSIFAENLFLALRAMNINLSSKLTSYQIQNNLLDTLKNPQRRETLKIAIVGNSSRKGLLDTSLFQTLNLSKLVSSSLEAIPSLSSYVNSIDFSKILDNLSLDDLKYEFTSMFEVIEKIFDNNDLIDISKLQNIDLTDEKTSKILVDILNSSEKSKVFTALFPPILKNMLYSNNFDFSSYLFNVTPYDLNYESKDFTSSIKELVSLIPDISKMRKEISSVSSTELKIKAIDSELLRNLLVIITDTETFNSPMISSVTSTSNKNLIANKFITGLFTSDGLSSLNYKKKNLSGLNDINWGKGVKGDGGEIDLLISAIESIKKNPALFSSDKKFLNVSDYASLKETLNTSLNSYFLEDTILNYIDSSINDYFKSINVNVSISEMRSSMWLKKDDNEISDIDRLITILKIMKNNDFNNFNYLNMESDDINILLTSLKNSNFIEYVDYYNEDKFSYVLYSLLNNSNNTALNDIFTLSTLDSLSNNFNYIDEFKVDTDVDTLNSIYTTKGGIKDFVDFVDVIKIVGIDNIKDGKFINSSIYKEQIESIKNGTYYESNLIKSIYSNILKKSVNSINFSSEYEGIKDYLDTSIINKMSGKELEKEVELFEELSKLTGDDFNIMFSSIHLLKQNDKLDTFSSLILKLSDSTLFKTVSNDKEMSALSYLFLNMNKNNNLLSLSTLLSDEESASYRMISILNKVNYSNELKNNFLKIINSIQNISLNDLSLSSLDTRPEYEVSKKLFTSLNNSEIYHLVPIDILRKDLNNLGFDELSIDYKTSKPHPLIYKVHLDPHKKEDISYWQNDIDNYMELIYHDENFKKVVLDNKIKVGNATLSKDSLSTSFIYYLSEINSLKDSRPYITYNMIRKTINNDSIVENLLRSNDEYYNENEKAMMIEKLFFSNNKFDIADKEERKEMKLNDLKMFDNVINVISSSTDKLGKVTSIDDMKLSTTYETLFSYCLKETPTSYYRSDISSEFVSSFMKLITQNVDYFDNDIDFYKDNYLLINPLEGKAIDSRIEYHKAIAPIIDSQGYVLKSDIAPYFEKFGYKITDTSSNITKYLIKEYNMYDNKFNSKIILSNKTYFFVTSINVKDYSGNTFNLYQLFDVSALQNGTKTFYEILNEVEIQ